MSNITLSSTSDTPEQVNAALGITEPAKTTPKTATTEGDEPETGSEPVEVADESTAPAVGEKRKGGFQKRIDQLTADRYRLDAENKLLKEQLAGKPAEKSEEKKPEVDTTKKPVSTDFQTYEDYIDAVAEWKIAQFVAKSEQEKQKTQQETARAAMIEEHTKRLDAGREKYSDFDEVTDQELPINQAMQDVIFESEHGAELAYWLGKNPEDCKRIARLTPTASARELGKIEAKFGTDEPASVAATETPKPKVTSAAPPIKPVGAKTTANTKKPSEMNAAEYRSYRESGGGK